MASTVGPSPPSNRRLSIESLPTVDLRLLSQSELTALSLCSSHSYDLRRCDDVVIPKIDRTVFNESAGSRKQTYSRLRLAPRNNLSTPPQPPPQTPKPRPSLDSDNSRIISLFKRLFNGGDFSDVAEKNLVNVNVEYSEELLSGGDRKRKARDGVSVVVSMANDNGDENEKEKELVNKNGEVVDLQELGKKEDPYGEEIKKRTEGKESPEELLGFVWGLDGEWGSTRKKRKIVDANMFGDALPNGWKLLIAMKKKQGRAWLFCRRYISPNGRYFVSCKEVSLYLLSLTSPHDVKQQPPVECLENAVAENKIASESATDLGNKAENPSLSITTQSDNLENLQKPLSTSENFDHEKQVGVLTNVLPGGQATSSLKCHKCSTTFGEKDELLCHLISCHKRKRRKSGAPIEEDIMLKDGKYECQFCNKEFYERGSYFGHVGQHVKNYVKTIGGSPGLILASKPKDTALTTVSETVRDIEVNANSGETHIENGEVLQNDIELTMEAGQNNKTSTDVSPVELDGTSHTTENNNVREVALTVDFSSMKPVSCSGSEKENENGNLDTCENFSEINTTECIISETVKASPKLVVNSETPLITDTKLANVGTDGNFASESDLLFENKETSSYDQNSEDRSLASNTIKQSCITESLELGDDHDDTLINGFDVRDDDVEYPGTLDGTLDVLQKEEDNCITAKRNDFMESSLEKCNENSVFSPSSDKPKDEMQNFEGEISNGLEIRSEVDLCDLEATGTIGDISNKDEEITNMKSVESRTIGDFHVEQSEEPKSDQVMNSGNLSFPPEVNDSRLTADVIASNDQSQSDVSNLLGAFDNFVEDKQEEVPKNIFSDLSLNQDFHEIPVNNMADPPSTTAPMQLPELDKVDCSRSSNKLIFDFGSNTDINSRFLGPVQNETTSPFALWGQQTCTMEDNQNRIYGNSRDISQQTRSSDSNSLNMVGLQQPSELSYNLNKSNEFGSGEIYGSARGLVQEESASDNNLLNLVGLQQPSNDGFNLNNKVHRSEQRYGMHLNETCVYNKNNDASTLNLSGFQQQCDGGYNLNKSCINPQSYGMQCNETGNYSTSDVSKQERGTYGNSLSLASVPQTCEPRYSMNKACMPQTCDTGFGSNKGYVGTTQELSKLDVLGHSRDQDLMIGFGNSGGRASQNVANDFLWRAAEGNILPGGLMDSSTSQGQTSGSYQAFDFLSDKGGNNLYASNHKYDNISSFETLRPTTVEPMEFSFMSPQESNLHLGHKNVLEYNNPQINQGFGSSVWQQKPSLPNMMGGHVVTLMCVWCGNEFHQDSLNCEIQAGSIGYLCPTCKARMSGQFL